MGAETEAKWVLRTEDEVIARILGLVDIVDYDPDEIALKAKSLTNSEAQEHFYVDHYYLFSRKDGINRQESLEILEQVELEKRDDKNGTVRCGNISFDLKTEEEVLSREFEGFINLLRNFFSSEERPSRYKIRTRKDDLTGKVLLTMKYKHGTADAKDARTEEYEVEINSRKSVKPFLRKIGYKRKKKRTKTKIQEKFTLDDNERLFGIEFNRIVELGTMFLEIEEPLDYVSESTPIEDIYEIARILGISDTSLPTSKGGNLENRGYQQLLRELRKGRKQASF